MATEHPSIASVAGDIVNADVTVSRSMLFR